MKKISLNFLFPLVALILLIVVLDRKVFSVPPLGTFLNPFIGAVQNEEVEKVNRTITLDVGHQLEILFDNRDVPHIFSKEDSGLFFGQGYVCASDRLWQMDFMTYASAGRLSELFGKGFLRYDREQRRNGILQSALLSLEYIEKDPETKAALDAYTAGVNAWIDGLSFSDLPLEYKLMDYKPEPWTNLKSVLIMKYMSANLAGYEEDVSASYLKMVLGSEEYDKLYANFYIDKDQETFSIERIADSLPTNDYLDYSFLSSYPLIKPSRFNPRLGSNSWVVSPQKSESGSAILANDPHLNLSLPAIWYELQLKSNQQNVYGFSIPGVPGVVIGFNENIAWGLTNGSTDVRDYYKLELKEDYRYYNYDGEWIATDMIIEEIKVREDKTFYDTVFYSIHGPIPSDFRVGHPGEQGCAVNWTIHDPSNEFLSFLKLNKSEDHSDFTEAIKHYQSPVQNFSYADTKGNIALNHQGKILAKNWKDQGKFILDGTRSDQFAQVVLDDQLPYTVNPDKGYVFSANNNPYNIKDSVLIYGHYTELRADKIESHLSSKEKLSIEDMKLMQLDNTNRMAELALPILLKKTSADTSSFFHELAEWNYKYDKESKIASFYERWWKLIRNNTWDELMRYRMINVLPNDLILLEMIKNEPDNHYFDRLTTEEIESASDIINISFEEASNDSITYEEWGNERKVNMMHLSNIADFSVMDMIQGGHPDALNATSENWGPSLRMIVEMQKRPKGYAVYAGGQSGNPASPSYDSFVDSWSKGHYYQLKFFPDKEEGEMETVSKWIIR
ncbi:MAG: penicillin acylase family protein [Cyclobacteriaceae bacterium]